MDRAPGIGNLSRLPSEMFFVLVSHVSLGGELKRIVDEEMTRSVRRYGVDIGRLLIYQRSFVSQNYTTESLIWALGEQQGREWRHGFAPVQTNGRYQIIVEGIRGKSFEGDIALDDIGVLTDEACTLTPVDADPVYVYQQGLSCDFEQDLCQWKFDPTGDFNWTRHTESTPSMDTGPTSGTILHR